MSDADVDRTIDGEDLAAQLRSINESIDQLRDAVRNQNGRVTTAEQWIDAHQRHSDDVNARLDAIEDRLTEVEGIAEKVDDIFEFVLATRRIVTRIWNGTVAVSKGIGVVAGAATAVYGLWRLWVA